jgi:broad specificity phosphatase PhoE
VTRIILVRHGQTGWNEGIGERFRGRTNLDLNETGINQAEATAGRIAQWQIEAVYFSPLPRAMSTARILARPFNLQPQPLEGLIDIDYGRWQGLSLKEAESQDPQLYSLWLRSPHLVTFPQGEGLEGVQNRVVGALETLQTCHPNHSLILVSHKVVCKVLICYLLGVDSSHFWQIEQHPCAINLIEATGKSLVLTLLNDTCHLKNIK